MKPRIRKLSGLWFCCVKGTQAGIGYTPMEAYDDWLLFASRV